MYNFLLKLNVMQRFDEKRYIDIPKQIKKLWQLNRQQFDMSCNFALDIDKKACMKERLKI